MKRVKRSTMPFLPTFWSFRKTYWSRLPCCAVNGAQSRAISAWRKGYGTDPIDHGFPARVRIRADGKTRLRARAERKVPGRSRMGFSLA